MSEGSSGTNVSSRASTSVINVVILVHLNSWCCPEWCPVGVSCQYFVYSSSQLCITIPIHTVLSYRLARFLIDYIVSCIVPFWQVVLRCCPLCSPPCYTYTSFHVHKILHPPRYIPSGRYGLLAPCCCIVEYTFDNSCCLLNSRRRRGFLNICFCDNGCDSFSKLFPVDPSVCVDLSSCSVLLRSLAGSEIPRRIQCVLLCGHLASTPSWSSSIACRLLSCCLEWHLCHCSLNGVCTSPWYPVCCR